MSGPRKNGRNQPKAWFRQTISVTVLAFLLAVFISEPFQGAVRAVDLALVFPLLLSIILIGILFDVIGVGAIAAEEKPFHAMAAKRIPGAKQAMRLVRRADLVATFAIEMVGEVTATIAGAAGAVMALRLAADFGFREHLAATLILGVIAALNIGGKAAVKGLAIRRANDIVFAVGRLLYYAEWLWRFPRRRRKNGARR